MLSSSSIQTEHAKKSWKRMVADKRIPVGVITTSYTRAHGGDDSGASVDKTARYFIDYRRPDSTERHNVE